jgi:hypothetical protein
MTSEQELAGGEYTAPIAAGAWTPTGNEVLIGFICGDTSGDATLISYVQTPQIEPDYTACLANHWYRFIKNVEAVTFSMAVTGVFRIK